MDEQGIVERIDALVAEEHELRAGSHGLDRAQRERLRHVEEHLDQLWDLLRRRRALRESGQDPADARERPVSEVESYLQ
ncbi:MAG: DUF2630 family protein [Mycobacteriales bacterium]